MDASQMKVKATLHVLIGTEIDESEKKGVKNYLLGIKQNLHSWLWMSQQTQKQSRF